VNMDGKADCFRLTTQKFLLVTMTQPINSDGFVIQP